MLPTSPAQVESYLARATPAQRAEIEKLLLEDVEKRIWRAQVGRQQEAIDSKADITGYGGSAGGGKTDLIAGLAATYHQRSAIFRREKAQTEGIVQRITEIIGSSDGYNSQKSIWRIGERLIEFGGLDNPDDHTRWQGRPHDLKAYDEVTEMREAQVRFTMGWNRTSKPGQRSRVIMTFNPPTSAEGRWVIDYFAPWLDDKHSNPAKPGELRWFTTVKGKDLEVPGPEPFVLADGEPLYDFDPTDFGTEKIITPLSRTFIASRVTDNYFYVKTGYINTLQSMPEPLRSQLLDGDFNAGVEDDRWQVIPTEWIDAAVARWRPREDKGTMDAMGVDPAMGGRDKFVIAPRHGNWFDHLIRIPGSEVKDGQTGAALVIKHRRDNASVHVDIIGWGSSTFNMLQENDVLAVGVNASEKSLERSKDGNIPFRNLRAEMVWRLREALDPTADEPIDLPPDPALRADLAAYKWKITTGGILVRSKDEMKEELGRSPDDGDAVILAYNPLPGLKPVYSVAAAEITQDPFRKVPPHWRRGYAMKVEPSRVSILWGAYDQDSDILYAISEHSRSHAEASAHAQAVVARGAWMPGFIETEKAGVDEVRQVIDVYRALNLNVDISERALEAGISDMRQRVSTGRFKVFSTCTAFLAEYRSYRRDDDGSVIGTGLIDCGRILSRPSSLARMKVKPVALGMPMMRAHVGDRKAGY